jgi:nitrogen fixation/metabolism regulation signal transduction histidine kinase
MEHMAAFSLNRYLTGITPFAVLSVLLAVALFMMSAATQNSALFGHLYSLLLVVSLAGIALLLLLIAFNVHRLVAQYRKGRLGSRLTLRLLGMFVLLTVIPLSVLYVFSIQMLNKGIDSWFDVKVEEALDDALLLGRTALDSMKDDMVKKTQAIARELEPIPYKDVALLNDLRDEYEVAELTLFSADGRIIASSSYGGFGEGATLLPDRPSDTALTQARQGVLYANLDPGPQGLQLRVLVPVHERGIGAPARLLQVLQPVSSRYTQLGTRVEAAFAEYEKLLYLRAPLKYGFTLTLTLVALLTLLLAVWAAIFSARRLVAPVHELAQATRAVAEGDYRRRIPVKSHDEFGVLVQSFNDMTRRISRAQGQIKRSQQNAEAQRAYLETVLTHLSSGVLSLDARHHLRTHNASAGQILGLDLSVTVGRTLKSLADQQPQLAPFVQAIETALTHEDREWHAEASVASEHAPPRTLILRGTPLPGLNGRASGHVVVFDDVSALIQAQRDAAWAEVARRLAHEIKNPLTPIQLATERIRYKCMERLPDAERELLDRSTRTIIAQVDAMKSMVNEFADYARPAPTRLEPVNLNALIRDLVELYKGKHEPIATQLQLAPDLPAFNADPKRLRQVLHNLLLNAADALVGHAQPAVTISTHRVVSGPRECIQLEVCDNGPGFARSVIDHLFEPYVTSKEKGTGLGLAIVKKIVDEHGGTVLAANRPSGGACVTLRLPLVVPAAVPAQAQEGRA